ncbi:uncharacterized protein TNCV_3573611 [Trichonephila clavipes]|nr:uncharacterized protein TNCV_3573611 [Trichonephila clavipes]
MDLGNNWAITTQDHFFTSLIRPVLEYGSQIYFSASRTNLAKLDRVQSSAARIITGMRHSCPTDLVLFEADIMPLGLRRKLLLSKYFCKLYSYGDYNRISHNLNKQTQTKKRQSFLSNASDGPIRSGH